MSQVNWYKPLTQITEELSIHVSEQTFCDMFADEGYHHRVACVKPFLSINAKVK